MASIARLDHYRRKLREKGIAQIVAGRLRWYKQSLQMDNWLVGRAIELFGNKVTIDGVRLSLDNPLVTTRHKSSIYFGYYETQERALAKRFIDPALPLIEIGGSIGGVACLTNKMLADPKAHVVVECNPMVLPTLEANRNLNGCGFAIEPRALAYGTDTITFSIAPEHFMMGHIGGGDGEQVTVGTVTLGAMMDAHGFERINLISDSEGTEVEMVQNEGELLRDRVKTLILETHAAHRGAETIADTIARLEELGFTLVNRANKDVVAMVNRRLA